MIGKILNFQSKSITGGAFILALFSLFSRFLGLVREWLLADKFGATQNLDIYFTAFRIPDLVYNVLVAGGIVVAFLPLFSEAFSKDKKRAWEFTSNLLNIFLAFLVLISFLLFLFTPQLLKLIAPGFSSIAREKCVILTRLMLLSPIFFTLSSIFSGILHYFNRFLVYGLAPVLYNLGIIFGILFLSPKFSILGVGMGVVLGAFFHFLIQVPSAINCGFQYKGVFNLKDSQIKKVLYLMFPRIFATTAQQINLIVITAIASTLTEGSISIFNFANNLQLIPVGILGIPFAMAAFPSFTKFQAEKKNKEFLENFQSVFFKILYTIVPITIFIFFFRREVIGFILEHGKFSGVSAQLTASTLGIFCFGLWALTLIPLILRAFFALKDTKTPTIIAVFTVILNIGLSLYFVSILGKDGQLQLFFRETFRLFEIKNIQVLGLPLAFSISSILQFLLLLFFLWKKLKPILIK
ncbi:murein biosynthesis integral membrane protein MurJ [bacterium]|nr:murein biosynthesis integral membrane protein MurJ [bacterium]